MPGSLPVPKSGSLKKQVAKWAIQKNSSATSYPISMNIRPILTPRGVV